MTAKISASADGTKVYIGNAAENALEINSTSKTINPVAPYTFGELGPIFRAKASGSQSVIANVADLCLFQTEIFDSAGCYNPAMARFTPNKAGYYQINACAGNFVTGDQFGVYISLRGSSGLVSVGGQSSSGANSFAAATVSDILYFNGTTDYIEVLVTGLATSGNMNVQGHYFSGAFVRKP